MKNQSNDLNIKPKIKRRSNKNEPIKIQPRNVYLYSFDECQAMIASRRFEIEFRINACWHHERDISKFRKRNEMIVWKTESINSPAVYSCRVYTFSDTEGNFSRSQNSSKLVFLHSNQTRILVLGCGYVSKTCSWKNLS